MAKAKPWRKSHKYIEEAFRDADGLNVKEQPYPRVTEEMDGIIAMVTLIDKGFGDETMAQYIMIQRNSRNMASFPEKIWMS